MKSLKQQHRQLNENDFIALLNNLKSSPNTLHFFADEDPSYFFQIDNEINSALVQLHKDQWEFDQLFNKLDGFRQGQLIQAIFTDEISASLKLADLANDKKDAFCALNRIKTEKGACASLTEVYRQLLMDKDFSPINDNNSIRLLYNQMMKDALNEEDTPDGWYFRNGILFKNEDFTLIHNAFVPELKIIASLSEAITIANNENIDFFLRLALSHYLFQTIHPFYDGNGRLARFMLSRQMYHESGSILAFTLSKAISEKQDDYNKAFLLSQDEFEFGYLNPFVLSFCSFLHKHFQKVVSQLNHALEQLEQPIVVELSKSEEKIYRLVQSATLLGSIGVSANEILQYSGLSRRTLVSAIDRLKELKLIKDKKISRIVYYHSI